jgi:thioredoxin reductase (NADPH)
MYDIIIVGAGPAGLTAAIYALRANKSVLILDKGAFGGQIAFSPKVENYPAFPSITGAELADKMVEQALEMGAEVEVETVIGLKDDGVVKTVITEDGNEYSAKAVIIACGAKHRHLNVPNEEKFLGNGISFCAVCDGAFYKGETVAVNGGGNSALQDAMLLSETCKKVYLIHRRDTFRGEAKLVEALRAKENVEFVLNARVVELVGADELSAIVVEQEGQRRALDVAGLFVAVGHAPDNDIFAEHIELDKGGYAASGEDCLTRSEGIFVAGDCRAKSVHQLTTAVGDGSVAALAACSWIDASK